MVWEIPRDKRPSHVCNPWVWIPDIPVTDVVVEIRTVDELMDHLRTIPRSWSTDALALTPVFAPAICVAERLRVIIHL